jgi:hypothetical protein
VKEGKSVAFKKKEETMRDKGKVLSVCAILLAGALLTAPSQAYAWEGGNRGRQEVRKIYNNRNEVYNHHRRGVDVHRPRQAHGNVAVIMPSWFFRVVIGNSHTARPLPPVSVCRR